LLVFGSSNPDDAVYALDARDGSLVWHFQTAASGDQDVGAGPTISKPGLNGFPDGVVYIDGKDGIEYALDLFTGHEIWEFNLTKHAGTYFNCQMTAALVANRLIVGIAGYIYALNASTGAKVWRSSTALPGTTPANVQGSPSISGPTNDQVIMIGDLAGVLHAYRVTDGEPLFSLSIGLPIYGSPAVASGMVFFAAKGQVYALSPRVTSSGMA